MIARSFASLCLTAILVAPLAAEDKPDAVLPLKKVVLFNSGVGYYEHLGQVEGNRRVDLKFNVDDVNDLLKSLVLQDLDKGKISTVTYGSKDPITKTLRTFAIDLTSNPTLAALLDQVRGEQVEVEMPNLLVGTLVGIETRKQKVGDQVVDTEYLNLLTDEGLRSLPLGSLSRIRLVNRELDAELRKALSVLALGHATDKKTVTLNLLGEGRRRVRVGYVQESPIWKTSYRLVMAEGKAPFLQGWAIIENTTEEDWNDVHLTLVSGRPISFVMNLYEPLYVPRPVVEPELFASLRPQTYGQDLARSDREFAAAGEAQGGAARKLQLPATPPAPAPMAAAGKPADAHNRRMAVKSEQDTLQLQEGVSSVAEASNVGELFQYEVETPVSLPRQQSAMIPIVQGDVKAEKLSIYNPAVHAKHPLNGLRLVNSTGAHLMQGPITVFDGGVYAGDARIEDLTPGTERLVSYALDLDTEVALEAQSRPEQMVSVRITKGLVLTSRKYQQSRTYTVKNSGDATKSVLIEYPYDNSWKLVAPAKPTEKTRDLYRFAVAAEPGKPAKLTVDEEQTVQQQAYLNNLDDNTIQLYLSAKVVSDAVKTALAEVLRQKRAIEQLATQQQQRNEQIASITQEQTRIRDNMGRLDRNSDLYQRYVKKFSEQEDTIERLREQIAKTQQEIDAARRSLDDYLSSLVAE